MKYKSYFAILASSALVIPIVVPTTAQAVTFTDTKGNPHEEAIYTLLEMGIVSGYSDGTFLPNKLLTRSDVVKMIGKWLISLGYEIPSDYQSNPRFIDLKLSTNEELLQYAALVKDSGILVGTPDGMLNPGKNISRENMAIVLVRAYEFMYGIDYVGYVKQRSFKKDVSDYEQAKEEARPYIEVLDYFNITNPSNTQFQPKKTTSRGQFASFIARSEVVKNVNLVDVVTIAGTGRYDSVNGLAQDASFRFPTGIVALQDNTLLVADRHNQTIRKIQNNKITILAGLTLEKDSFGLPIGGLINGNKELAFFNEPNDLAVDSLGNIYIADSSNHAIRKITVEGQVTTLAGNGLFGHVDEVGENAMFNSPQSIVCANDGTLYVADTLNHVIRKVTTDGKVSTLNAPSDRVVEVLPGEVEWAGDFKDGPLKQAKFNEPSGLALDEKGNLFVSDSGNQLIRYIDFSSDKVSTIAGNIKTASPTSLYVDGGFTDGPAGKSAFQFPKGLAFSKQHGLFIADSMNKSIRLLRDGKVHTIATGFLQPTGITVDAQQNVFVTDSHNNTIKQIKFK
ncbi:MAG: S-layer homology domain-containing protein [Lysinibacillus sp.]